MTRFLMCSLVWWALSGCVPWHSIEQPALTLETRDIDGNAIEGARVHFVKVKITLLPKTEHIELQTNSNGQVSIDKKSDWHMAALVPDGNYSYEWFLCVEKDRYRSVVYNALSQSKLSTPFIVVLQSAQVSEPCIWSDHYPFGFKSGAKNES